MPTTLDLLTLGALQALHGHICPGYASGIRIGEAALREMGARDVEKEIGAVVGADRCAVGVDLCAVGADRCAVDGIQSLLGCALGKGNWLYLDHGLTICTVSRREDGHTVRIALKSPPEVLTPEQRAIAERIAEGLGWGTIDEVINEPWKARSLQILVADQVDVIDVEVLDDYVIPDRATRMCRVGDRPLGVNCRQGLTSDAFTIRRIGTVHNDLTRGRSSRGSHDVISRIALEKGLLEGLTGLVVGDKLQVLWFADGVEGPQPLLQRQQGDPTKPLQGVFTLRSQCRPNPIGMTTVTVLAIDGRMLTVRGLDAWDETPVIDLKPVTVSNRGR